MKVKAAAVTVALALGAGLVPLVADAPPIPRIGLLADAPWEPLREGLRDLGYVEGKNIVLESRHLLPSRPDGCIPAASEALRTGRPMLL